MPELSLTALLFLGFGSRATRQRPLVYVGELPRYFRLAVRSKIVRRRHLLKYVGILTRCEIRNPPHDEAGARFADTHMAFSEGIVHITSEMEVELREEAAVVWLTQWVGAQPAMAYMLQNIAHVGLAPQMLSLVPCRAAHPAESILLVPPVFWPESLALGMKRRVADLEVFKWPKWIIILAQEAGAWSTRAKIGMHLCWHAVRVGDGPVGSQRPFKVATEFVDPDRLRGGPHDADYLVDGQKLSAAEIVFFVTGTEEARLRRQGIKRKDVERLMQLKGYSVVWLQRLRLSLGTVRRLLAGCLGDGPAAFRSPWRVLLPDAVRRYTTWSVLFEHHRFSVVVYPKFPNGNTGWRTDTAVVTGLARQHRVLSVGMQNRTIYAVKYEAAFECYDRYFLWGSGWYEAFGTAMRFVGKQKTVGCIYLDAFPKKAAPTTSAEKRPVRQVAIFTGDISAGGHYSLSGNVAFVAMCLEIAAEYSEFSFKVKCKDAEHAAIFEADPALRELRSKAPNLTFLRQARHSYRELLLESEIVLSIGYTTPGTEALLLGRKAFYYGETNRGAEAYRANPLWVATNAADLKASFDRAVNAPDECLALLREGLDTLDPFRDGDARRRILDDIFA